MYRLAVWPPGGVGGLQSVCWTFNLHILTVRKMDLWRMKYREIFPESLKRARQGGVENMLYWKISEFNMMNTTFLNNLFILRSRKSSASIPPHQRRNLKHAQCLSWLEISMLPRISRWLWWFLDMSSSATMMFTWCNVKEMYQRGYVIEWFGWITWAIPDSAQWGAGCTGWSVNQLRASHIIYHQKGTKITRYYWPVKLCGLWLKAFHQNQ